MFQFFSFKALTYIGVFKYSIMKSLIILLLARCLTAEFSNIEQLAKQRVDSLKGIGNAIFIYDGNKSSQILMGVKSITNEPITENTMFEIGSLTKTFTALILLDSINNKTITHIDDPVENYLPPNVSMPSYGDEKITFRHLVTHTSALPRTLSPEFESVGFVEKNQLEEFLNNYTLTRGPGIKYSYSNLGFVVLGYVLQHTLNKTYDELVFDTITSKLNMTSTKCLFQKDSDVAIGHSVANVNKTFLKDYTDDEEINNVNMIETIYRIRTPVSCSSGGLFSTLVDLKTFLMANLYETDSYISKLLHQAHNTLFQTSNRSFGYAWHFKNSTDGTKVIYHDGATIGFTVYFGFNKEQKKGIFVLSNLWDYFAHKNCMSFLKLE